MSRPTPEVLAHRSANAATHAGGTSTSGGTGAPVAAATAVGTATAGPAAAGAATTAPHGPVHVNDAPMTGAAALVRSLEALGVDVAFGIPGGAILPLYDPLFDSP